MWRRGSTGFAFWAQFGVVVVVVLPGMMGFTAKGYVAIFGLSLDV
jgi:hypothetical protein